MKRLHEHDQHFLRSPRLVHELVGHSDIKKRDLVLDIRAGTGVISSVLAKRAGQVQAIEIEPGTFLKLRQSMNRFENVEIIKADVLSVALPSGEYKVFSNIPFRLSSKIVHRLVFADNSPSSIYLIVQKQFAKKLMMDDTSFTSQLGTAISPWYSVRIRRSLKKTDFWPNPAVDTVLVELKERSQPLLSREKRFQFDEFTLECFADSKFFAKTPRATCKISSERKPSEIAPQQWVALFNAK